MTAKTSISVVMVDDELHCRETLEWELSRLDHSINILAKFDDPLEAVKQISSLKPDILFLDVEMPGMNGFELLDRIKTDDINVVFTTAHDKFAVQAFRVCALDFLLKPVDKDALSEAVERYLSSYKQDIHQSQLELLLNNLGKHTPKKVAVPTGDGLEILDPKTVVRCESDSNYTTIFFDTGKLLISKTLRDVEQMFEGFGFLRVHNSHLINLDKIKRYVRGDGGYLEMMDNSVVNVSRSRKQVLLDLILK